MHNGYFRWNYQYAAIVEPKVEPMEPKIYFTMYLDKAIINLLLNAPTTVSVKLKKKKCWLRDFLFSIKFKLIIFVCVPFEDTWRTLKLFTLLIRLLLSYDYSGLFLFSLDEQSCLIKVIKNDCFQNRNDRV